MVFIFQVTKLWPGVLNIQVLHHEVRLVKMWKIWIESVMRSAYIWWCYNILGISYITWWHMNQRFEAACCKICAHLLKDGQTQNQLALWKGLQEQAKKERGFYSKFRAVDESWICGYYPGTKQQSSQWKSHPPAIQEISGRWSQTSRTCCLFSWTVRQFFRRSFFLQC